MRFTFLACLLCLVSFPILADDAYTMEVEIIVGGVTLGTPTLSVYSDTKAKVVVDGLYELSLTAKARGADKVFISTSITIEGETVKPSLLVQLGKESSVRVGGTTLRVLVNKQ